MRTMGGISSVFIDHGACYLKNLWHGQRDARLGVGSVLGADAAHQSAWDNDEDEKCCRVGGGDSGEPEVPEMLPTTCTEDNRHQSPHAEMTDCTILAVASTTATVRALIQSMSFVLCSELS